MATHGVVKIGTTGAEARGNARAEALNRCGPIHEVEADCRRAVLRGVGTLACVVWVACAKHDIVNGRTMRTYS